MKKILILPCLALVVTCFVWISVVNDNYKSDSVDSGKNDFETVSSTFTDTLSKLSAQNNDVFYSEQAESSPHCKSSSEQMVEKTNSAKAERTSVDLGLPSGLKWATCNVGAKLPWETGLYFAWGETTGYTAAQVKEGKKEFSEAEFKRSPAASISTNLTPKQDAAHVNMGGKWRMPTNDEFGELIVNCNAEWKGNYNGTGVAGRLFTSKNNGNSIFFPAAGRCINSLILGVNSWGGYWSASDCGSGLAMKLYFQSDFFLRQYYLRCCGFPVRAVCEI